MALSIDTDHVRIAIVGSGFAGLGAAIRLKQQGIDFAILERAHDVGGTWRDNSYPGSQCDVPSHLYSFSFAPNPAWSRTYSLQPEIFAYLRATAETTGVLPHIRFGHEVRDACWDEAAQVWLIDTGAGPLTSDIVIFGGGALSEPFIPDLPGLDRFEGRVFHSARWDHDHDLTGRKVAVVGTGASAIQFVPEIQPEVEHLSVFQRTAPWVLPHPDRKVTGFEKALYARVPLAQRLVRAAIYWSRELLVIGLARRPKWLKLGEWLGRALLAKQVHDPDLRASLTPHFSPGCKRLLLSNDWFPALQQPNVDYVTGAIREVRAGSIVTADGFEHECDTIIFGTGFKVTNNPMADLVRGTDGRTLHDTWEDTGIQAYVGTTVPGFPNLFLMTGANTWIGHTSLVVMIEAQLSYILDCLRTMERRGIASVEVQQAPFRAWNDEVQTKMKRTVWSTGGCASWYIDAEGRNTTLWPDFTFNFTKRTKRFDGESYRLTPRRAAPVTVTATPATAGPAR